MAIPLDKRRDPDEVLGAADVPWLLRRLGAPSSLTRHQLGVLRASGAATLFANYGLGIMGLALVQIQAGLHVSEAAIGGVTAFVQLGMIPALVVTMWADSAGRRRLLLISILGFSLAAGLTALVQGAPEFIAAQLLARVFIFSATMLAVVVVAEELDADARGWGIGMVGAAGALGHGLVSIVFANVNVLPYGWRALYGLGVLPLLFLPRFQRGLRETRRFARHSETRMHAAGLRAALQPLAHVVRMYPGRMAALCTALFPAALVFETATMFQSKFLQEAHHYAPGNVALLYLTVGVVVPIGNVVGGSLGDRFGRKRVMVSALIGNAVAVALFYHMDGVWVPLSWGLMNLTIAIVTVLFAALGSELFPTSYRSTAAGVRSIVATLGAVAGLWTEGRLYVLTGTHAAAITGMLVVTPIAPLIVAACLPETASCELEEISPERGPHSKPQSE
ncbi:MAG TPA: MFS transporter [Candidatus Acidoferrales bacterium]|nr:MFS transporter [Candidatus Acidoferrales bacterium]